MPNLVTTTLKAVRASSGVLIDFATEKRSNAPPLGVPVNITKYTEANDGQ
jgi:hypothetical protein